MQVIAVCVVVSSVLGSALGLACGPRLARRSAVPRARRSALGAAVSKSAAAVLPAGIRRLGLCIAQSHEICGNALDDNCNGLLEEGCGFEGGRVQFMIAWPSRGADVDLHVVEPGGEFIEVESASLSGFVKPEDCPGRNDECEGTNLENVYLEDSEAITTGEYRVSIRLESLGNAVAPVWVTLSARLGSQLESYEIRLEEQEQQVSLRLSL